MRSLLLVLALGGCLRQTQFQCETDTACGTGGVCESSGFCSFVDKNCDSGRRYADSAGPNSGQCTGGGGSGSAVVDSGVADAREIDAPPGCPAGFTTVAGAGTHVYKVIATADTWTKQQTACRALTLNAYLMVPDDAAELAAIDGVAGAAQYWVGINDIAMENKFVNVLNMTQTFLPWQPPAPDDAGPGEDCVVAISASNKLNDERCNSSFAAVCECAP